MTVRELIRELEEYPMDLPVVNDLQEIDEVEYDEGYYLNNGGYDYSGAVVLR